MIRKLLVILIVLFVIGSMPTASAQYNEEGASKFSASLTSFYPMNSQLKGLGSIWLGPALDWNLKRDEDEKPLSYLTLGLLSSGDGLSKASETFITYTQLKRTPISDTRSSYTGIGIGMYSLSYKDESNPLSRVSVQSYKPGIHILYGQEFNEAYFAEIKVNLMQSWEDVNWSGIYLSLGIRL